MRVLALALLAVLAACGGDDERRPAPAKAKDARCTFKRVWYPPALPGHEIRALSAQQRRTFLKEAHLPDPGTDVVVETKGGKIVAQLYRVRRYADAVKRRYDAVKRPPHAYVSEPLPHFRLIQRGHLALEYGRLGCALLVGIGRWEPVDFAFVDMYADR